MDWNGFIDLVSTTRLVILFCLLTGTIVLGVLGALKAKTFKWSAIALCLEPSANFFYMIIAYILTAGLASLVLPDSIDPATIVTTYTIIIIAMGTKLKTQLSYLFDDKLPVLNWKLPLEMKS